MRFLWDRFQEATTNPHIAATHRPKAIETEIRLLLERNTFYADLKTDARLKHRQNGYCPEFALHDALIDAFGCNVEHFANPLDVWGGSHKPKLNPHWARRLLLGCEARRAFRRYTRRVLNALDGLEHCPPAAHTGRSPKSPKTGYKLRRGY